jgi:hypothetical protein
MTGKPVFGKVVHCKKEPFDVYIGRNKTGIGKWGNPFPLVDPKDEVARKKVVDDYKEWLYKQPKLLNSLHELRGKTLACWCSPRLCHGDVLNYLVNDTPGTLRLIVAGSRGFTDYSILEPILDKIAAKYNDLIIIEGEARGADLLGKEYAQKHGYDFIPMPALWRDDNGNFDKAAGYKRNENMAKIANAALIFWDGLSPGSKSMITLAKRYGLLRMVYIYPEERFCYESSSEEFRWD